MGQASSGKSADVQAKNEPPRGSSEFSEEQWKQSLKPDEYQVLRGQGMLKY